MLIWLDTHSDWASDTHNYKSTLDYSFSLGFGPIKWSSKKKNVILLSSIEEKYRGAINMANEAL